MESQGKVNCSGLLNYKENQKNNKDVHTLIHLEIGIQIFIRLVFIKKTVNIQSIYLKLGFEPLRKLQIYFLEIF